jgi:hypothetical protein
MLHVLHSNRPSSSSRVALATNFPKKTEKTHNNDFVAVPWNDAFCAPCISELDCPRPEEYCGKDNCCTRGECRTDEDCFAFYAQDKYYKVPGFESFGYDLNPLFPQDNTAVLEAECSVNPKCVAYNSYGMLKHHLEPASAWIQQPPLKGLTPWITYIKKSELDGKNPNIKMTHGVKSFCSRPVANNQNSDTELNYRDLDGMCRQCLFCEADSDCPNSEMCNTVQNCCVNNPCFTATAENGKWVDAHYSREPQCDCPDDKPHCCLSDRDNIYSAQCSAVPCDAIDRLVACSYICESPTKQFDSVFCKANQRCCNKGNGPPMCCSHGSDCSSSSTNQCEPVTLPPDVADSTHTGLVKCPSLSKRYDDVYCFPTQTCCNQIDTEPPVCCNNPAAGCHSGPGANGCKYSDLTT